MSKASPTPAAALPWRLLAAGLIVLSALFHVAYLTRDCPLDLAPDEAHYWDWSRHLDWSYYSKGPLVAYLIRAGAALAGDWSRAITGTEMPAVRLPAVACGTLLLVSLYVLTVQVYRSACLAAGVVAMALTLPLVSVGSSLMTIDAPYTCLWGWALVFGHKALVRGRAWAWPVTGLVVGFGILAKYTMVLWLPSAALFLITSAEHRPLLRRHGFWVMAAIAGLCTFPVWVWNYRHGWVSLLHVGGQAGVRDAAVHWLGPLSYLGTQFALLMGFWFVAWLAAMIVHRPDTEPNPSVQFLWWMSAPMFAFFWLFSLKTAEEPNWPVTAYLSGLVLTAGWIADRLRSPSPSLRRWTVGCLAAACGLGILVTWASHFSDRLHPLLSRLTGDATAVNPLPLRRIDPTCRLRGWRTLAEEIDRLRADLRRFGQEPVLAGANWTVPGELGLYCEGHPTVYSLGPAFGDRHSQYDLWEPNPLSDPDGFRGRTFLIVGETGPGVRDLFESTDERPPVLHAPAGYPLACWKVTIGRGFRPLSNRSARLTGSRF